MTTPDHAYRATTRVTFVTNTRVDDGWAVVERGGLASVPQGQPFERATSLLERLAASGLHVVPVGEVERWVPEIGGHGPSWVADVLDANRHADEALPAREFIRAIADAF